MFQSRRNLIRHGKGLLHDDFFSFAVVRQQVFIIPLYEVYLSIYL